MQIKTQSLIVKDSVSRTPRECSNQCPLGNLRTLDSYTAVIAGFETSRDTLSSRDWLNQLSQQGEYDLLRKILCSLRWLFFWLPTATQQAIRRIMSCPDCIQATYCHSFFRMIGKYVFSPKASPTIAN